MAKSFFPPRFKTIYNKEKASCDVLWEVLAALSKYTEKVEERHLNGKIPEFKTSYCRSWAFQ
jgi:hypothetical protein